MFGRVGLAATAGVACSLAAAVASAGGVAFTLAVDTAGTAELRRINLVTGAGAVVGAVGLPVRSLAFDSGGALYGVDVDHDQLVVIDVATGSGVPVGALGLDVDRVTGISFDELGHLWLAAIADATGPSLLEVDPGSGAATWRAALPEEHLGALAGIGGLMYMASSALVVVDTVTGEVAPVHGSDLGIWAARAMDRGVAGQLRALLLCTTCMAPFDVLQLQAVDPEQGIAVVFGPVVEHGTWGLATQPGSLSYDGFESGDTNGWNGTTG